MSFYTSSILSEQIDPALSVSNTRAIFKFDGDKVYLSNLRLLNVGGTSTADKDYDYITGALSLIKDIVLSSDGVVLDQLRNVNKYGALLNFNKPNDSNKSLHRFLTLHNMGYEVGSVKNSDPSGGTEVFIHPPFNAEQTDATENATAKSWLDLKMLLPILNSVLYLPTQKLKNLELRIDFVSSVFSDQTGTTTPLLIADSMVEGETAQKMVNSFQGATYVSVEQDNVVIPAIYSATEDSNLLPNKQQSIKKMLKGFDNKYLNRIAFQKEPGSDTTTLLPASIVAKRNALSQLYYKEKENLRVNGRQLDVTGLDSPNKALANLTDVYGTCNSIAPAWGLGGGSVDKVQTLQGRQDWRSFLVSEYIEDLEVSFERQGAVGTAQSDANNKTDVYNTSINLIAYGQVRKQLNVMSDGTLMVSYPRE